MSRLAVDWPSRQAPRAALILGKNSVSGVRALVGGYEEWKKRGEPIVKETNRRLQ